VGLDRIDNVGCVRSGQNKIIMSAKNNKILVRRFLSSGQA
jgi:hypothetical protein